MPIDIDKARDFVYRQGTVFERALFAWLFDDGDLAHLHATIRAYENPDGGFGHGFEHDLKAPQSNPLALEYLLGVMKHAGIPPGDVLDGAARWVEANMERQDSCAIRRKRAIIRLRPGGRNPAGRICRTALSAT